MKAIFFILGLFLSVYLLICFYVWIQKKKRKSSPSAVISVCYDGISFLKIGESRSKVIAKMEQLGLLDTKKVAEYRSRLIDNSDDENHDYVLSEYGFLEFKEYDCIFYNDFLCGIQMKFKDSDEMGDIIEESKKHISILNGKYEQTDDGRFIWTQKNPYRLIVLSTTRNTLSVYDYNGMYPQNNNM